jgi:hypothetical protein
VETLTRKALLQEIELERITKQLKEAIAIAGEGTKTCKAAKEVSNSLTGQVRLMFNLGAFWITVYMKSTTYVMHGNRKESYPSSQFCISGLSLKTFNINKKQRKEKIHFVNFIYSGLS